MGRGRGYGRYLASSIKGEATIDWSDKRARKALLAGIVADADRLLELSRQAQGELPEDSEKRQGIVAGAEFCCIVRGSLALQLGPVTLLLTQSQQCPLGLVSDI